MKDINNIVKSNNAYNKNALQSISSCQEIVNFIQNNNLTEREIENNLIYFMDYKDDLETCKGCTGIDECSFQLKGYQTELSFEERMVVRSFRPCRFAKHIETKREIARNIKMYHLTGQVFKDASLLNILHDFPGSTTKVVMKKMNEFFKDPTTKGLYIHGKTGVGKTYFMSAFVNKEASLGEDCAIITLSQLSTELRRYFGDRREEREAYQDILETLKTVHILVIDGIGSEAASGWLRDEILFPILDARYNEQLPTFFTSIFSLKELEKYYTFNSNDKEKVKSLLDRINGLAVEVELIDKNHRD